LPREMNERGITERIHLRRIYAVNVGAKLKRHARSKRMEFFVAVTAILPAEKVWFSKQLSYDTADKFTFLHIKAVSLA
ncbi:MAG: hypothetical protein L0G95_04275, partial [Planococcus sp. (in: firmicutes)]|nr:hypothetical protein [Planococcus sp. (in: firmicutes)]